MQEMLRSGRGREVEGILHASSYSDSHLATISSFPNPLPRIAPHTLTPAQAAPHVARPDQIR